MEAGVSFPSLREPSAGILVLLPGLRTVYTEVTQEAVVCMLTAVHIKGIPAESIRVYVTDMLEYWQIRLNTDMSVSSLSMSDMVDCLDMARYVFTEDIKRR